MKKVMTLMAAGIMAVALLAGCSDNPFGPKEEAKAEFEITEKNQHELTTTEKSQLAGLEDDDDYSDVTVYYTIKNTGTKKIKSFTVWFKVTCKDGSAYIGSTTGNAVLAGKELTGKTAVHTSYKEFDKVVVDTYELTD